MHPDPLANGEELIWYRGQQRVAARVGGLLLIEGDIEVVPEDRWGPPASEAAEAREDVGVLAAALKRQGDQHRWPGVKSMALYRYERQLDQGHADGCAHQGAEERHPRGDG